VSDTTNVKNAYICGMNRINIPKESSSEVIFGLIEKERKVRKDRVEDLCRVCGIEVARYYRIKRGEVRLLWYEADVLTRYYGFRLSVVKDL